MYSGLQPRTVLKGAEALNRLPRECQSSGSVWTTLSGKGGIVGVLMQDQDLESVIFLGPFHLRIFHDSMILITSPAHFASRACREFPSPALRVLLPTLAACHVSHRHLPALTPVVLGSQRFGNAQLQSAWTFLSGQGPSLASGCHQCALAGCSPLRSPSCDHPVPRDQPRMQDTREKQGFASMTPGLGLWEQL